MGPMAGRTELKWTEMRDDELLDVRFCDLKLRLDETPLADRIERLYGELARRDLTFRPHFWLAEEWFSPDGVPGVAIPFYLAHPRLTKLEYQQMFEVEGGTDRWCMRLLRHETGHAIDTAYRLHRRKIWRQHFGVFGRAYPKYYTPRPQSRRYVLHLDWWYAQCHPAEDYAETFAVWLRPRSKWRREYADWPALKKLEAVDQLMASIAGTTPPVRSRRQIEPLSTNRKTMCRRSTTAIYSACSRARRVAANAGVPRPHFCAGRRPSCARCARAAPVSIRISSPSSCRRWSAAAAN